MMGKIKAVHLFLAEDNLMVMSMYRVILTNLAKNSGSESRQENIPEYFGSTISLTLTCAATPLVALGYVRQEGSHFDAVLSDGTGWFDFAIETAKRFPVVGRTGDSNVRQLFLKAGIPCHLKELEGIDGGKNPLQICVEVLRLGLGLLPL